jgi:hypothetical protein
VGVLLYILQLFTLLRNVPNSRYRECSSFQGSYFLQC